VTINTHYLVDLFSNPFSGAPILDVRAPENGQSRAQGAHVIRIPAAVSVANPSDLADLLTKKYTGLLASYPGYTYIDYDDLLDATGIDPLATGCTPRCTLGSRGGISVYPLGSSIKTVTTTLSSVPAQVFITFEIYQWAYDDPSEDLLNRTYVEVVPSPANLVLVTFDNWAHNFAVSDGSCLNIPPIAQGNQFALEFMNNTSTQRFWIGSWAVIY
jgi:hypothetical protein